MWLMFFLNMVYCVLKLSSNVVKILIMLWFVLLIMVVVFYKCYSRRFLFLIILLNEKVILVLGLVYLFVNRLLCNIKVGLMLIFNLIIILLWWCGCF